MERQPLKRKRRDGDSQASDRLFSSIPMKGNPSLSPNCIFDTLSDDLMFKICEYLYYDYESDQECFASVSDIGDVYKLSLCSKQLYASFTKFLRYAPVTISYHKYIDKKMLSWLASKNRIRLRRFYVHVRGKEEEQKKEDKLNEIDIATMLYFLESCDVSELEELDLRRKDMFGHMFNKERIDTMDPSQTGAIYHHIQNHPDYIEARKCGVPHHVLIRSHSLSWIDLLIFILDSAKMGKFKKLHKVEIVSSNSFLLDYMTTIKDLTILFDDKVVNQTTSKYMESSLSRLHDLETLYVGDYDSESICNYHFALKSEKLVDLTIDLNSSQSHHKTWDITCPNLKYLVLQIFEYGDLGCIFYNKQNLCKLDLDFWTTLQKQEIESLLTEIKSMPNLEKLHLYFKLPNPNLFTLESQKIRNLSLSIPWNSGAFEINCPNLRKLEVDGVMPIILHGSHYGELTDVSLDFIPDNPYAKDVEALVEVLPSLRYLRIDAIDVDEISTLSIKSRSLSTLRLCEKYTLSKIVVDVCSCPKLTKLFCSIGQYNSLDHIFMDRNKISYLSIRSNNHSCLNQSLAMFSNLESLYLIRFEGTMTIESPSLQSLDVEKCTQYFHIEHCKCPSLKLIKQRHYWSRHEVESNGLFLEGQSNNESLNPRLRGYYNVKVVPTSEYTFKGLEAAESCKVNIEFMCANAQEIVDFVADEFEGDDFADDDDDE
ncbi:predicted protein [Chaetoceros tenuissimus]|uniref:F-box domain-containing protein n=1 Tax=Chaetoceros tenuissimus TaxID=426638 RepID=A0AAD3D3V4_9STRA|nr:predicted protein [Chaetoceros tenuissimus]